MWTHQFGAMLSYAFSKYCQVSVGLDLTIKLGREAVRLTPSEGFNLAEHLIRRSTARMCAEEIEHHEQQAERVGDGA